MKTYIDDIDAPNNRGSFQKYAGELFGILCHLTSGDAKLLVRGVPDSGTSAQSTFCEQDGFLALYLLDKRYNSKSTGNLIKCFRDAINPPKIKDVRNLVQAFEDWKSKVNVINTNYPSEKLGYGTQTAVLVGMLPKELQDYCFTMDLGKGSPESRFELMKDKIVGIATQRVQMCTPQPMDIGSADRGDWEPGFQDEWAENPEGE